MGERKSAAFDHSELREIIRRKLGTELEFAKRINISRRAVSMKLNGHWDWKRSEMIRACEALGMDDADIMRMFFQRREDLTEKTERPVTMRNTGKSIEIRNGNATVNIEADGITASVQSTYHPPTESEGDCR